MFRLKDVVQGTVEIGKAMSVTLTHLARRPVTVEFPEEPVAIYPRYRGRHELRRYENGLERCIFCGDCEEACPVEAIVLTRNIPESSYDRRSQILTKEALLAPHETNVVIRVEA